MAVFKCKMCGGSLDISDGVAVATCEYCGTKQTVPKSRDEFIANLFNRANNLRLKCEFDKAEQVYEKILDIDDTDPEAHWGIVLCKYGIEYVEDPKTYARTPTCHRTLYEAVLTDANYLGAIENAEAAQKELYIAEAKVIDELQKSILNIVNSEEPFDVFICYKETDENGKRTVDSAITNDIYYQLTQEGFKVFYAPITLENKLGYEYEPYIFAALNSAKVMLVVGTKPEYFDSVWVRNEWSRFLKLTKSDRSKMIIPCYRDMDAYDLPDEFAHLQAQDMSKIGFINDIVRGINKLCVVYSEVKNDKNIFKSAQISPLIERAYILLEDGEFKKADDFCEQVLNLEPKNAQAYLIKLLIDLKIRRKSDLEKCLIDFSENGNFKKIQRFGEKALVDYLENIINDTNNQKERENLELLYQKIVSTYKTANTIVFYDSLIRGCKVLDGYKDSNVIMQDCIKKRNALIVKSTEKPAENKFGGVIRIVCIVLLVAIFLFIAVTMK